MAEENNIIEEKVKNILGDQLSRSGGKIKLTDKIVEDLGADSLDIIEMMMSLEEEYGITIPEEQTQEIVTVGDLVEYIANKKQQSK